MLNPWERGACYAVAFVLWILTVGATVAFVAGLRDGFGAPEGDNDDDTSAMMMSDTTGARMSAEL
jgi:hypothetical protein